MKPSQPPPFQSTEQITDLQPHSPVGPTERTHATVFAEESDSNAGRRSIAECEPLSQRTYTPTLAIIARSAGQFHYTPEGRRLADFTSGVLVANLGHNPTAWWRRLASLMRWDSAAWSTDAAFIELPPLTAYNAASELEIAANKRLLNCLQQSPLGRRLEQIVWCASGSEGVQKALWAALHFHPNREIILATRHGFHGKKGLSEAVTGDESSPNRDARVHFIDFPKTECRSIHARKQPFDPRPYRRQLDDLWNSTGGRINCLITEPYLGGGGSYHPPAGYLNTLQEFCREHDVVFILDEVQSNFGRTGEMFAFETYGIEPDLVVLGKGMGNGIPVNAVAGRAEIFACQGYGGTSDTWSGHPLGCAAVLATIDEFESSGILVQSRETSRRIEAGLLRLGTLPIVAAVRGEGMVWGVEMADVSEQWQSSKVAVECVRLAYLGDDSGNAIHLLGPLAGNVLRISPPLCMTPADADFWMDVLFQIFAGFSHHIASG